MDIQLIEYPPDSFKEILGIKVDFSFRIMVDDKYIGHIHSSELLNDEVFVEWVEIFPEYRGKGYFRKILLCLMRYFNKYILNFECGDENLDMYKHLGSEFVERDEIREMNIMVIHKNKLLGV